MTQGEHVVLTLKCRHTWRYSVFITDGREHHCPACMECGMVLMAVGPAWELAR